MLAQRGMKCVMRKRRIVTIVVGMLAWAASAVPARASILLATYEFWTHGGGSPAPEPRVEVILQLPTEFPPTDFFGLGVGLDVFWADGDQGSFDFTSASDPAFDAFAASATDGRLDLAILWTLLPSSGGSGDLETEENIFGNATDLIGFNLETVRLVVHEASITPWNPDPNDNPVFAGYKFDITGAYEFYGSPVPEPGTFVFCVLGIAVFSRRARPT